MRRLICCEYHEDSESVELRYTDGTLIDIDCLGVEDEVARNSVERSELTWLLHRPGGLRRFGAEWLHLVLSGKSHRQPPEG